MYSTYKPSTGKAGHGKKTSTQKGRGKEDTLKEPKPAKPKPEWNDAVKDETQYKLSALEIVQKKASLMSKHRLEAKEQWQERQMKLQSGVVDAETKSIYDTARQSKNLSTRDDDVQRKNLSQMLNFIPKPIRDQKSVVQEVKTNLQETRKFIQKAEQYQKDEDPNRLLRVMDRIQKNSDKSEGSGLKRSSSVSNNRNTTKQAGEVNPKYDSGSDNEETKENKQDMANYFTSLNKIEETIRFMEEKILCEKKNNKTETQHAGKSNAEEVMIDHDRYEIRDDNHLGRRQETKPTNNVNYDDGRQKQDGIFQSRKNSRNSEHEAVSFVLTEEDEDPHEIKYNDYKGFSQNQQRTKEQERNSDEVQVRDFECNLMKIDPNMFFGEQNDSINNRNDELKSDFQRQFENTLSIQPPATNSFKANYDHIAAAKLDQLKREQKVEQKQIYPVFKQQREEEAQEEEEQAYFYEDRYQKMLNKNQQAPSAQIRNSTAENNGILKNDFNNQEVKKDNKKVSIAIVDHNDKVLAAREEEEDNDDFLSKNIDSIKQMLEATKRDLEGLDAKGSSYSNQESSYSSQVTANQLYSLPMRDSSGMHGKKTQLEGGVQVVSRLGEPLKKQQYQQQPKIQSNTIYSHAADSQSSQIFSSATASAAPSIFTSNLFMEQHPPINTNYSTLSQQQAQKFQSSAEDTPFTSNLFMNAQKQSYQQYQNTTAINKEFNLPKKSYVHDFEHDYDDAPRQLNIVKQDLFKKNIQSYSAQAIKQEDSLSLQRHLR